MSSKTDTDSDDVWARLDFFEAWLDDQHDGSPREVSAYVDAIGHDAVADEFRRMESASSSDAAGADSAALAPETLVGRYRVTGVLGRGGQAVVYRAVDTELGRDVALKVLVGRAGWSADRQFSRLRREAEFVASLDHPGICTVYEFGQEGEVSFVAMRLIPGRTLARLIRLDRKSAPATRAEGAPKIQSTVASDGAPERVAVVDRLRVVEEAARALHHAHEMGMIHRDVKPGNIMVPPEGGAVVLDFGLARDVNEDLSMTATGDVLGTPGYLSPEQISGVELDRRTDVFSLGVTLYESIALARPFDAPTHARTLRAITEHEPKDLRRINREVSRDVAVVVGCALAKDRERRYATCEAFAEDLRRIRENKPVLARPPSPLRRFVTLTRRHPIASSVVGLLLLGISAALAWSLVLLARTEEAAARDRGRLQSMVLQGRAFLQTVTSTGDLTTAGLRRRFSNRLVASLEQLLEEVGPQPQIVRELSAAYVARSQTLADRNVASANDWAGALSWIDRAEAVADQGLEATPGHRDLLLAFAGIERARIWLLVQQKKYGEAEGRGAGALAIVNGLLERDEGDAKALNEKSLTLEALGDFAAVRDDHARARELFEEAMSLKPRAVDAIGGQMEWHHMIMAVKLGGTLTALKQYVDAEKWLRSAVSRAEALLAERPESYRGRRSLMMAQVQLGQLYRSQDRLEEAAAWFRRAVEHGRLLVIANPLDAWARSMTVRVAVNIASPALTQLSRAAEARALRLLAIVLRAEGPRATSEEVRAGAIALLDQRSESLWNPRRGERMLRSAINRSGSLDLTLTLLLARACGQGDDPAEGIRVIEDALESLGDGADQRAARSRLAALREELVEAQ